MELDNEPKESVLQRHFRLHDEDKIAHPKRHSLNQNIYTREEVEDLCVKCCHAQLFNDYELDKACNVMRRKMLE